MKIAIRVDASVRMGMGHLKRCLSLARALRNLGSEVIFIVRELDVDSGGWVRRAGFALLLLRPVPPDAKSHLDDSPSHAAWAGVPQLLDAAQTCAECQGLALDWMLVDSYSFDADWHDWVRHVIGVRLCVIDDLGDRPVRADLLVDQNLASSRGTKWCDARHAIDRMLVGPRFALLDPCYENALPYHFNAEVRSIGVFMGGTDPWNASEAVVAACRDIAGFNGSIEIATTASNPHLASLRILCENRPGVRLQVDAPDLSAFFARHDLHLGAGGGASWERCRMGVPTMAMAMAENQRGALEALAAMGAVRIADSIDPPSLGTAIAALIENRSARGKLASRSRQLVDGRGAKRVALAIMTDDLVIRPANAEDAVGSYPWRNAPQTRRYFRDPSEIELTSHRAWWLHCIENPQRRLFMAVCGGHAVGVLRLDLSNDGAEVSLYVDPDLQGLGLGSALLKAGQEWTARHEPTVTHLTAEILPGNEASAALFHTLGFTHTEARKRQWETRR